jgi:hypothetical protein
VGGAGQHAIFSGDPAFARAFFVARHFFFYRSCAQHLGVAKFDQNRAFGVHGVVAGNTHGAQLVSGAGVAGFWESVGHRKEALLFEKAPLSANQLGLMEDQK